MPKEPNAKFKAAFGLRIHELMVNDGIITSRVRVGADVLDNIVDFSGNEPLLLMWTRRFNGIKVEHTFTYKQREKQPEQVMRFDPTKRRKGAARKGIFEDVTESRLSIEHDAIPDVFALVLYAGGQDPEVLAMAKKIKAYIQRDENKRMNKLTDKALDYHGETLMEFNDPPPGPAMPNTDSPRILNAPPGASPPR